MDKIDINLDLKIEYSLGDINLALKELAFKNEDIDWEKSIALFKQKAEERIKWFMGEYEWLWFIDALEKKELIKNVD